MFPLFDRFFDANACATAAKIPNMSCTEITLPNSSRAAILLPTNATTIHQQKDNGPGKQLQLASYYPGDPGQPPYHRKTPNWPIYVGDQDLDNILDTVLTRFKVQVDGVVNCPTSDGKGGLDMVETTFWIRSSKGIIT
ncbi:hypothetical protein PG999_014791 [Apiospora kogelbergensis]|uniref:Uncharacterized protein n=1 Tax=Apiospora kogelbergensis TaxID=1337665 RepID=A0AAW0Q3U4_9PEZI